MELQPIGETENKTIKLIKRYFDNQKVWLTIAIVIIALFTYGELTGTRFFFSENVDDWKPNSNRTHGSNHNYRRINHK